MKKYEGPRTLNWEILSRLNDKDAYKLPIFLETNEPAGPYIEKYRKELESLRDKLEAICANAKQDFRTHFKIAAGQVTMYFIMPYLLNWLQKEFPFLKVRFSIFEIYSFDQDFSELDYDVIFSGKYSDMSDEPIKNVLKQGYVMYDQEFEDHAYLAASEETVREYGGIYKANRTIPIIFGRSNNMLDDANAKVYVPRGRANEKPKHQIDSYYWAYTLMQQGAGSWVVFKSMKKDDMNDLIILDDEPVRTVTRVAFYRPDNEMAKMIRQLIKLFFFHLNANRWHF